MLKAFFRSIQKYFDDYAMRELEEKKRKEAERLDAESVDPVALAKFRDAMDWIEREERKAKR